MRSRSLGERESGTARLERRSRLSRGAEECTRERVPLDWATTQNNLGTRLRTLGERESGTARLEEAVAAYRAALGNHPRARAARMGIDARNLAVVFWLAREPGRRVRLSSRIPCFALAAVDGALAVYREGDPRITSRRRDSMRGSILAT